LIHNMYYQTIDKIKASDDFKRKLKLELQAHAVISKMSQTKKIHFTKRWMAVVASILVIATIVIWQGNTRMFTNNHAGALTPHFKVDNRVFWYTPTNDYERTELPDDYKSVGTILSIGDDYPNMDNFQSSCGSVGDKIYMDPTNPNAAYLYTNSYEGDGTGSYHYILFVTNAVLNVFIHYNGSTYIMDNLFEFNNDKKPWAENAGYKCVGTVQSVDYTRVPSQQLETNFINSLGCEVYASESNSNIIYIYQPQVNGQYVEMKKQ